MSEKARPQPNVLFSHVVVGAVSGIVAALSLLVTYVIVSPAPVKLATVDVAGLVSGEIQRLQEEGMDAARAEAYAMAWGKVLDRSVQTMAEEYGVVLLVGPSVVAGAPDLTEDLKERLDREIAVFK